MISIETKFCPKCSETKPLELFDRARTRKDGRASWCKECKKATNKEYIKTKDGKAVLVRASKKYAQTEHGKAMLGKHVKAYSKKYPEKTKAKRDVNNAVRDGRLDKPLYCCVDSSECHGRIEGHHTDYSKPLHVIWLC